MLRMKLIGLWIWSGPYWWMSHIAKKDLDSGVSVVRKWIWKVGKRPFKGSLMQKVNQCALIFCINYGNSTFGNRSDLIRVSHLKKLKAFYKNSPPLTMPFLNWSLAKSTKVKTLAPDLKKKFGEIQKPTTPISVSYTMKSLHRMGKNGTSHIVLATLQIACRHCNQHPQAGPHEICA